MPAPLASYRPFYLLEHDVRIREHKNRSGEIASVFCKIGSIFDRVPFKLHREYKCIYDCRTCKQNRLQKRQAPSNGYRQNSWGKTIA